MARHDAVVYIKKVRRDGYSEQEIRRELEKAGWPSEETDLAFIESRVITLSSDSRRVAAPQQSLPKEPTVSLRVIPEPQKIQPLQPPPLSITEEITGKGPLFGAPKLGKKEQTSQEFYTGFLGPLPKIEPPSPSRTQTFGRGNIVVENIAAPGVGEPVPGIQSSIIARTPLAHRLKFVGVIVGACIFIGSGAFGGYWYYTNVRPKNILQSSLDAFATMQSYHYETDLELISQQASQNIGDRIPSFAPPAASVLLSLIEPMAQASIPPNNDALSQTFRMHMFGDVNTIDGAHPKSAHTVRLETKQFFSSDIEFEARTIDRITYFQFLKVPRIPTGFYPTGAAPFDTGKLERVWVKIDPEKITDSYNEYIERLSNFDSAYGAYKNTLRPSQDPFEIQNNEKIKELFHSTTFIVWKDGYSTEDIKGEPTYRYSGIIDKKALENFLKESVNSIDLSLKKLQTNLFEPLQLSEDITVQVWVSTNTKQIIKITMDTRATDVFAPASGTISVTATARYSRINENIAVAAPKNARDVKQILDAAYNYVIESLTKARIAGRDARRVADLNSIRVILELYYDDNGNKYPRTLNQLVPKYIPVLPKDSGDGKDLTTSKPYTYKYISAQKYLLSAKLENPDHSSLKTDAHPGDQFYDLAAP